MDESTYFRDLHAYQESNQIIEANASLSNLNVENFEKILIFLQGSILVTSKKMIKSFIRSLLNVIRFKTKNLDLYATLCKNLETSSKFESHVLIEFLKDADFMTPSQFKFYRLCITNKLLSAFDVINQISVILYFNITHSSSIEHLIPLFIWFLPEIYNLNPVLYNLFLQRLQKNEYILKNIKMLKYEDWALYYQYEENQYINLKNIKINNLPSNLTDLSKNSIEYCLQEDDIDQFQKLTQDIQLTNVCNISLFDLILTPQQCPTFSQFSALHSSIKCFKYLFVNNAVIPEKSLSSNIQTSNQTQFRSQYDFDTSIFDFDEEPKIIVVSSSSTESEQQDESESSDDDKSDNSNDKTDNENYILVGDSDSSENEEKREEANTNNSKSQKEIIVISDSSSDDESSKSIININEPQPSKSEKKEDSEGSNSKESTVISDEIKEKSSRYWIPPIYPGLFTLSSNSESTHYIIRKSLFTEFSESMKIATTPQYAIAGGNTEIIRLLYDSNMTFTDTIHIAVSCFFNNVTKWLLDDVFSSDEIDEKMTSNLLQFSITTGNIEMLKYIIFNMPSEVNDRLNSLNFIPIHLAIKYHQVDVLSFLLNLKSIDVNNIDKNTQKTAFFLAVDQKSLAMTKLIASHPFFNFNHITCGTLKPIHYVALYGTSKIMKFFISLNGVDVNDNISYKIEDERKQILKRKKNKKTVKESKAKKSKNFLDDDQLLFFIGENENNKKEDEEEEEEKDNSNDNYYFNYSTDFYNFENRNSFQTNITNTPIVCSLVSENIENFFIIANDQNLKINTKSDQMPLHFCISRDLVQIFTYLLSNKSKTKIDIDAFDRCGTTSLHYAILRKKKWAIEQLISEGCDITKRTICEGDTVYHLAAFSGYFNALKKFIKMKVFELNVTNFKKQTVLHYATIHGASNIVGELLTLPDIDVNACDIDGNTSLHYSIQYFQSHILESLLSNQSIDVNAMNNELETPLIFAFKFNNQAAIKRLLSLNGIINPNCFESQTKNTPLHLAVIAKNEAIVRLLFKLHNRVFLNDISRENEEESNFNYYRNSFQYEFDAETNVNCQNSQGFTPLHIAAQNKNDLLVRTLLTSPQIQLDIVDFIEERCPLHFAAVCTRSCWFGMKMFNPYMYDSSKFPTTIFSQLINRDPMTGNIQDRNGDTAFHIALNEPSFEGTLLKNTAIQLNQNSNECARTEKEKGLEMIVVESDNESEEVLKLTLKNNKGETYLHLAAASGNRIVLDFMMKTHPELINERTVDIFNFFFIFLMEFHILCFFK